MKKSAFAAGILAFAMVLSACSKEPEKTKKSKKTKKTTESIETEDTEEPSDSSEYTAFPTETGEPPEETTTEEVTTEETTTTPAPETVLPDPTFDLDQDLYSFYADASYVPGPEIFGYFSALTSWSTSLTIDMKTNTFSGDYESAMMNLDGDGYDVNRSHYSGTIDGFKRLNEYSFKTTVTALEFDKFVRRQENFRGLPSTIEWQEPYGFTKMCDLLLFLPNTPLSDLPADALSWLDPYLSSESQTYLETFMVYNTSEGSIFVGGAGIPETREATASDLEHWHGDYEDKHLGYKLSFDKSSSEPHVSLTTPDTSYPQLKIRAVSSSDSSLLFYGTSEKGYSIVAQIDVGDGLIVFYIIESNDPDLPKDTFIYPERP